jgi:hypothetical protein
MGLVDPNALFTDLLGDLNEVVRDPAIFGLPTPPPDVTIKEFAACVLAKTFYKKFVDVVDAEADCIALSKFLSVNDRCKLWTLPQLTEWDSILVGELKRSIYNFWFHSGHALVNYVEDLLDHAMVGPGAAIDARGGDFYTKLFSSPLTATSPILYATYENYVATSAYWSDAESLRRSVYGDVRIVPGSRLNFVPKQNDVSRLICVEPSLNIFFQKGFGTILEARLDRYFGINLATAPIKNQELARTGSMFGSHVTIDMSSASDSIALPMLKEFLPADFLRWLKLLRSPSSELKTKVGRFEAGWVELNMISSMGNGFTFPLQTMFFSCIVDACLRARSYQPTLQCTMDQVIDSAPEGGQSLSPSIASEWSVFGDDVVCPTHIVRDVLRLLSITGFEVNTSKTFIDGLFRESCGRDYFCGHDVRGFYVKRIKTAQDRYAIINGLNLWSAKTGIPLCRTIDRLIRSVKYIPVPPAENDDAGIKVPFSLLKGGLTRDPDTQAVMYRRCVSRLSNIRFSKTGERVHGPRGAKHRIYNPSGLLISMLHGSVKSGVVHIRHGVNHYSTKWGVTPYWDYLPPESSIALLSDWQRWETAVLTNLTSL